MVPEHILYNMPNNAQSPSNLNSANQTKEETLQLISHCHHSGASGKQINRSAGHNEETWTLAWVPHRWNHTKGLWKRTKHIKPDVLLNQLCMHTGAFQHNSGAYLSSSCWTTGFHTQCARKTTADFLYGVLTENKCQCMISINTVNRI